MDFFAARVVVDIERRRDLCLLAIMELILRTNCSLLYLHSNDMNIYKKLSLKNIKEVTAINIIVSLCL